MGMQLQGKHFAGNELSYQSVALNGPVHIYGDEEGNLYIVDKVVNEEESDEEHTVYDLVPNYDLPDELGQELLDEAQIGKLLSEVSVPVESDEDDETI